ncbi:hypothetical protein VNO78_17142 [Psophocarpus tetragonolobus]|uniref:Uncharacterized protein n=1 Tax=Psophocarpus tetragonolobus TaxID=3891 RepID=A0AAN9SGP4_PSOTE
MLFAFEVSAKLYHVFGTLAIYIVASHLSSITHGLMCSRSDFCLARSLASSHGPSSEPGGSMLVDWTKLDQIVFTTNSSKIGWCNVDPGEAYADKVKLKKECEFNYDGFEGGFVKCMCNLQALISALYIALYGGFCQIAAHLLSHLLCGSGRLNWLHPAKVDVADNQHFCEKVESVNAVVAKKRPLLYVYYLPPDFDSLVLELIAGGCGGGSNVGSWFFVGL